MRPGQCRPSPRRGGRLVNGALASAFGKALAMIAALLHRGGISTTSEFAELLGGLASAVSAAEPAEHQVLTAWASTVRSVGDLERAMTLANGEALTAIASLLGH